MKLPVRWRGQHRAPSGTRIPKLIKMSILSSLGMHFREPVFLQIMQLLLHFPAVTIGKLMLFSFGLPCIGIRDIFLDKVFLIESLHVSHMVLTFVVSIPLVRRTFAMLTLTGRFLFPLSCLLQTQHPYFSGETIVYMYTAHIHTYV